MAEGHNYRVAVDSEGNHGYEIGFWPDDANQNDPMQYRVVARCYDQKEAALLAAKYDAGVAAPKAEPVEEEPAPRVSHPAAGRHTRR